jgi:nitrile hydratase beta subunit
MNTVHDMGGMHGMGRIEYDKNEGAFHEPWEGRAWAIIRAAGAFSRGRRKNFRYELESIPAVDYLRMSYYERLIKTMLDRLLAGKFLTQAELESGRPDPGSTRETPRLTPAMVDEQLRRRGSLRRDDIKVRARFKSGQRVRARNINPVGHTRLPRYLRGKRGTVTRDHGVFNLQDTDADGYALGEFPQRVYTVRFDASEVWGPQGGTRDVIFADLWESYLDRA